jgi:CYTH domain-containing protein
VSISCQQAKLITRNSEMTTGRWPSGSSAFRQDCLHGGNTWQVDVYKAILAGVVLAEIELPSETSDFTLPPWVGREATGDPDYKKFNMVNARLGPESKAPFLG